MSQSYIDLKNAIDYLVSLDWDSLEQEGASYLRSVKLEQVTTNKFKYPETYDSQSQHTNFDIFRVHGKNKKASFAYSQDQATLISVPEESD